MAHFRRVRHFSATPSIFAGAALLVLGGLAVIAATIGIVIIGGDRCDEPPNDGTIYCLRFILRDYCVGIWCGSLFFVSGLCSFAAGKRPYRALIIIHSVISFLSIVFAAVLITVAGITVGLSFDNRMSPPSIRIVPIPCHNSRNNDYYLVDYRTTPDYGRRWNLDEQATPSYGRQWYDDSITPDYWRPWIGNKYRTPPYYWRRWNLDEQSTPSYWKQWYDDSTTQDYWRQWIVDRNRTTADYWRRWNLYEGQTTPSENRTQWYDDSTTPDYWRQWFENRDRIAEDDRRRWNEKQQWGQNAGVSTAETTLNRGFEENATDTSDSNTTVNWWHMFMKDNEHDEGTTTPSSSYEQNILDYHPDYDRKKRQVRQDCHAMEINAGWLTQLIMSCLLIMIGFLAFILSIITTTTSWLPFCCPPEEDQNADSKKEIPIWRYRPPCIKTFNEIPTLADGEFNSYQSQSTMVDIVTGVATDKVPLFFEGSGSSIMHV